MNSVKTGVVVVVLLGVLYGVYKVLNVPEQPLTPEEQRAIELAENLDIRQGTEVDPTATVLGEASPGSPVAVDPYGPASPSPADLTQGSTTRITDFSVPPLTAEQQPQGSGNPNNFAPEPDYHAGESQTPAHETYATSADAKQGLEGNLPPLDGSATKDRSGAPSSYYAEKAGPTPSPASQYAAGDDREDLAARAFDRAMRKAEELVAQENYRDALAELTKFYDAPSLTPDEQQRLVNWLDPLAGKVIYSSEHQLDHARIVRSGETLADIAYEYGVPEQLLLNINRSKINNPRVLRPGTELKVLRGPFEAQVSLGKSKLTLFVGNLYAGHFPITLGRDPLPQPGTYYVKQIVPGREYVDGTGRTIPAESPDNPYGRWWIDLGSEMSIHGPAANGNTNDRGCISLSAVDIGDLAEILSRDSKVRIEE